jgi:hypothetical protein
MLLAKGLRRRGWQVSVVALSGNGGAAAAELRDCGVTFTSLGMRKGLADPRGWIRFNRWLRRERPDVLHAHLPHAAWLCRWSRVAAQVPVVIDTLHSSSTGKKGRHIGYTCSRWLPDHVTAVSRGEAADIFVLVDHGALHRVGHGHGRRCGGALLLLALAATGERERSDESSKARRSGDRHESFPQARPGHHMPQPLSTAGNPPFPRPSPVPI